MIFNNNMHQSIKMSNEISNFKIIPDVINIIKESNNKLNFSKDEDIIVSVKYGKRIVINCEKLNLKEIKRDDFLEIVDYNPIKKLFLVIGKHDPDLNMAIHWIVQNARREINILIQLKSNSLNNLFTNMYSNTKKYKDTPIEISKDILFKLRDKQIAYNEIYGIFIIGNNLKEIKNILNKLIEEI